MSSNINNIKNLNIVKNSSSVSSNLFQTLVVDNLTYMAISAKNFPRNEIINFVLLALIITFSSVILYYSTKNPTFLQNKVYTYATFIIIPVLFFFYMSTKIPSSSAYLIVLGIFATMAIIGLLLYTYSQMTATSMILFNLLFTIIIFLIVIIGLALTYNIFINYLNKQQGTLGFLIQFIFYIPCLLTDFIYWLFYQYKITPNIVFVLLVLEILFILFYIYLPKIMDRLLEKKGKYPILQGVSYLDKYKVVGTTENMFSIFKTPQPNPTYLLANPTSNFQNFSISMWIYLNPTTISQNEYNIFQFNSVVPSPPNKEVYGGLPKIDFFFDSKNHNRETYRIFYTNNPVLANENGKIDDSFEISITNQRWNHFVFNYDRNICDLYINGVLERSADLTKCLPIILPFIDMSANMTSLQMATGQDGGLYGAITNIEYYATPLTNLEIITKYNLLMFVNPPVYNTGI